MAKDRDLKNIEIVRVVEDTLSDSIVFALVDGDKVLAKHCLTGHDIIDKPPAELYMPMIREFSQALEMPPWELAKLLEEMAIREKELLTKRKFPQTSPPQPPRKRTRRETWWEFVVEKILIGVKRLAKKARIPTARVIRKEDE